MKKRNLINFKFGRLTVVGEANYKLYGVQTVWTCRCDCGLFRDVTISHLTTGHTKSCGCIGKGTTHGMSKSLEYFSWASMKDRCYNPNNIMFSHYGGRGIEVCDRWINSFENFYKDMGLKPDKYSLERIDVNGNYEPENCIWIPYNHQQKNTSRSWWLEYGEDKKILSDWARELNLPKNTLKHYLKKGYSLAEIIDSIYYKITWGF